MERRTFMERVSIKDALAGRPLKDKIEYLWTYYKWVLLVIAAVVCLVCTIATSVRNKGVETIYSGALINVNLSEEGKAFLSDELFARLGGIEGKQMVELTETFFMNSETSDPEMDSVASMRLVAAVIARELDYSIMNEVGYHHYKDQSVMISLEDALSPALLEQIRDDIVYYTDEENGTTCPQTVNITQWPFVRDCMEAKGEVYLTFSNSAESMEQNGIFLSYLLGWQ